MELSPGEGAGGSAVPPPATDSADQNGAGLTNQNAEGVVGSPMEIDPELYDFSSFFEGDIVDDVFLEFKEMMKAPSFPSSSHVVSEVMPGNNTEQQVQPNPSHPPQNPKHRIVLVPRKSGSIKWTDELHDCFMDAVMELGGPLIATPKTVRDKMEVAGLSLTQVKSHLQKCRIGKFICDELKMFFKRGSSFSRALGVFTPRPPRPRSRTRRKNGAKSSKKGKGFQHMEFQFQKHLRRLLPVQRQNARVAATRMAANQNFGSQAFPANQNVGGYPITADQNFGGRVFAANQNIGGYPIAANPNFGGNMFVANQNFGGYPIAANQNYGGHLFASNQKIGECSSSGTKNYAGTSAAAENAEIFIAQKLDQLQITPDAHPSQPTEESFAAETASGSFQQGFNSDSAESSGIAGMSEEEFVRSFLNDSDELVEDPEADE